MLKIKKSIIIFGLFLLGFAGWSVYDSENYFDAFTPYQETWAASGQSTSTLQATVGSSLTLTLDSATVALGTIIAGTPVGNYNSLYIDTNNATGYNISAGRNNIVNSDTLFSSFGSLTIDDSGLIVHITNCVAGTLATWSTGNSKGLGFSLYYTNGTKDENCWGTGTAYNDANNKYGAFAASVSATTIYSDANNSPNPTYVSVAYRADATSAQTATTYNDGSVIYTATTQ